MTARSDGRTERLCSKSNRGTSPRHAARDVLASRIMIPDSEVVDNTLTKRITCTAVKAMASPWRRVSVQLCPAHRQ